MMYSSMNSRKGRLVDEFKEERLKIEIEFLKKNKKVYLVGSWDRVINSEGKFIEYVKTNTEENVIVGETIYDHQGRPAVNLLPIT